MDFNFIIQRVMGILTKPMAEWEKIKGEDTNIISLFMKYAIILAAIPAVAGFLGWVILGMPFGRSFLFLIFMYVFTLGGVFLLGFIIDALAPSFDAEKNLDESVKIAVYASTAAWVAGIISLIPRITLLGFIIGLYSLYLLFLGIKIVKSPPKDKEVQYFVITLISYIVIAFISSMMVSQIVFGTTRFYF